MRHYVPVFQHHEDGQLCQGHASEAFSSRVDAAAAVADVLELGEIEELVLLDTDSVTKHKGKKQRYDITVTLKVCDCGTFVGESFDDAPFKLEGVGDNKCDLIKELYDDDEDDDGLEGFVSGFNKPVKG